MDPETNELYVSDGYDNKRVIVFDAETGEYRRHWGAYGNVPSGEVDLGPIYAADRSGDRIQVLLKNGAFVQEGLVAPETRDLGTAYGVAVSPDQRWLYVNDGSNNKIWILRRDDLETVGSLSSYGRNGGRSCRGIAWRWTRKATSTWAKTRGRRVQRWTLRGGA